MSTETSTRIGLSAGALIVLGIGAYFLASPVRSYFSPPPSDGHIIVNSPSIYTRQRLVNDRLTQTAWLKDQLEVTRNALGRFNSIGQVLVRERSDTLNLLAQLRGAPQNPQNAGAAASGQGGGGAPPAGAPTTAAGGSTPPQNPGGAPVLPDRPLFQLAQTTTDLFHALNNYREEIRSEMMQTLLDDRHDIQGNTIYRLAFDATVLAGRGANDLAIVNATLLHDPVKFADDYWDVYSEWTRFIQKTVNGSVEGLANSLFNRVPETRVRLMMSRFLVQELCGLILRAAGTFPNDERDRRIECNVWATAPNESVRRASQLLDEYVDEYLKGRELVVQDRFRQDLDIANYPYSLEEFPYVYEFARRDCRARNPYVNRRQIGIPQTQLSTPDKKFSLNCPIFTPPFEGLIGGLVLYERLMQAPLRLGERLQAAQGGVAGLGKRLFDLTNNAVCAPVKGKAHKICSPPEPRLAQVRCAAAEYIRWSLNGLGNPFTPADERIDTYLDMYTVGRALEDCNIAVTMKADRSGIADLLRNSLNESSEIYAYNVSPRNLARRVAGSISAQRTLQGMFGAQGSAGPVEGGASVDGARKSAERREELETQPFIIPFGRSRSAGSRVASTSYMTEFGWAIVPRRTESDLEFEDGQHALGAVISMPGWWRSVEIKITTCWIPRTALKQLANVLAGSKPNPPASPIMLTQSQAKEVCAAGQSVSEQTELIRVPGTIQEVSRKLGFEFVQEPNLDDVQMTPQVLQVGYAGEILLTGGRLWRSTEVTIGSQAADRIAVLPNMRGIIATFDCVRPQFLGDYAGDRRTEAEVKVWTSEGVANHPDIVLLEFPQGHEPVKGAKPCSPEKLGISSIAPPPRPPLSPPAPPAPPPSAQNQSGPQNLPERGASAPTAPGTPQNTTPQGPSAEPAARPAPDPGLRSGG